MKKWYDEEYAFSVEVTGFVHGDHTERYCRNEEEIGDKYACTYGCPVNVNLGGESRYEKTVVCSDGCAIFRLTAAPLGNENFHKGGFWEYPDQT